MSTPKRYFAVPTARVPEFTGKPDHTVFVQYDDGVGWAEASSERRITGQFAVVGTTQEPADSDPGTTWLGGAGNPWPTPPPTLKGETLEAYASRVAPSTVAPPPAS